MTYNTISCVDQPTHSPRLRRLQSAYLFSASWACWHRIKSLAHCWLSVKRLKTRSLGRTVCFFADQVIQTLDIPETSSTPSYVSLERLSSLLQNFTDQVDQLFDVFPTRHPLQSIQNSSKSTIFLIWSPPQFVPDPFREAFHWLPQTTSYVDDCPHCCKILCAVYTGFSALASLSDFVDCPKHQAESCWQIKY